MINNNMRTLIITAVLLFSSNTNAWYGPGPGFGPWGMGMGWGYGYGMGYMYPPIQYPTFNYQQTVIVQEPPAPPPPAQVIIRESPPRVIVEEREIVREVCDQECERLRRYFRKH